MTTIELAKLLQISQPYLSQIETGKKVLPIDILIKICNVLGITLEQFFSEKDNFKNMTNLNDVVNLVKKLEEDELEALKTFLELITRKRKI